MQGGVVAELHSRHGAPFSLYAQLAGSEPRLVTHFLTFLDPIAKVDIRQAQFGRLSNLPEYPISAITGLVIGLVKSVDRRQAMVEDVHHADHFERPQIGICRGFTEFDDSGVDPALQEKLGVLVNTVLVHAATDMAGILIAQIQRIVFSVEMQIEHPHLQVLVGLQGSFLASVGPEIAHDDAQGLTGLASITIGPVSEQPAAAKTLFYEVRVHLVMNQMAGCGNL